MRRVSAVADLSFYKGEPGRETDPEKAIAREKARATMDDELRRAGVDAEAFGAWLAARVMAFHETRHIEGQFIEPAAEIEWLHQFRALAAQVARLVRYGSAPLRAHAQIAKVAGRGDIDLHALRDRLEMDLAVLDALLGAAATNLREAPVRRGRKTDPARDSLLSDVTDQLQASGARKASLAGQLALMVLQSEGIPAPAPNQKAPEKAAERAARRVRKKPAIRGD